jgi:putative transposase
VKTSVFYQRKPRFGSRRIANELRDKGINAGGRRIAKITKNPEISAIEPKSYQPKTTDSRHRLGFNENLIFDLQEIQSTNRLWVADTSYIPVAELPFAYLAILTDRFSGMIVGWQMRRDMTEQLVLKALQKAIRTRKPDVGLIHHSDRSGQHPGNKSRKIFLTAGMLRSMSRAGGCYDNAIIESCLGTIQTELEMTHCDSCEKAMQEIRVCINGNVLRRHSAIESLSPLSFEEALIQWRRPPP